MDVGLIFDAFGNGPTDVGSGRVSVFADLFDFGFACVDAVGSLDNVGFAVLLDFGLAYGDAVDAFEVGFFIALVPSAPVGSDCGIFALACLGAMRFLLPIIS